MALKDPVIDLRLSVEEAEWLLDLLVDKCYWETEPDEIVMTIRKKLEKED